MSVERKSAIGYMLASLVPYTEANLKLVFKPNQFFDDLEYISRGQAKSTTYKTAYYRAIRNGMIKVDVDGIPRLTDRGQTQLKRYKPKKLRKGAKLLILFDIPESERHLRDRLRPLLRELKFEKLQKSVWMTEYDVLDYLVEQIRINHLREYVEILEASSIDI